MMNLRRTQAPIPPLIGQGGVICETDEEKVNAIADSLELQFTDNIYTDAETTKIPSEWEELVRREIEKKTM